VTLVLWQARARRLVELNVIEQCLNLYKTGIVQPQQHCSALLTPTPTAGIVQRKRFESFQNPDAEFTMPRHAKP